MKLYLQLKSWQLFIVFVTPMFLPIIFISLNSPPHTLLGITLLIAIVNLIGWLYSIGIVSNSRLPLTLKKNTMIYKICLLIPLVYIIFLAFFFPTIQDTGIQGYPAWLEPFHLASMFGMFYGLYFTAKQFTALKNDCRVKFIDFSGTFFLFWFYPIGVWFIQPNVNELLGDAGSSLN